MFNTRQHVLIHYVLIFILISCGTRKPDSSFAFKYTEKGVGLSENGKPVFFYQEKPKSPDGKSIFNNYLHPLHSINGDTLTEEFPADHPYHRGIYWAWHQIYINGESIGDGWIMENITQNIIDINTSIENNSAQLQLSVLWESTLFENSRPFIIENTTITVHPLQDSIRIIDITISLKALVPSVEIGGSDDEKGYGGLCARIKLPKDITFTSINGKVTPQLGQVKAGPLMDFSASFGRNGEKSGVSILCNPKTPNYPASWILRSETSIQNIVFPGRERVALPLNKPVVLYYHIIVHNDLVCLTFPFPE